MRGATVGRASLVNCLIVGELELTQRAEQSFAEHALGIATMVRAIAERDERLAHSRDQRVDKQTHVTVGRACAAAAAAADGGGGGCGGVGGGDGGRARLVDAVDSNKDGLHVAQFALRERNGLLWRAARQTVQREAIEELARVLLKVAARQLDECEAKLAHKVSRNADEQRAVRRLAHSDVGVRRCVEENVAPRRHLHGRAVHRLPERRDRNRIVVAISTLDEHPVGERVVQQPLLHCKESIAAQHVHLIGAWRVFSANNIGFR